MPKFLCMNCLQLDALLDRNLNKYLNSTHWILDPQKNPKMLSCSYLSREMASKLVMLAVQHMTSVAIHILQYSCPKTHSPMRSLTMAKGITNADKSKSATANEMKNRLESCKRASKVTYTEWRERAQRHLLFVAFCPSRWQQWLKCFPKCWSWQLARERLPTQCWQPVQDHFLQFKWMSFIKAFKKSLHTYLEWQRNYSFSLLTLQCIVFSYLLQKVLASSYWSN